MNNKISSRFAIVDDKQTECSFSLNVEETEEISDIILKDEFLEKISAIPVWFEYSDEKRKDLIKSFVEAKNPDIPDNDNLIDRLHKISSEFGVLQNLALNKKINAIFINGTKSVYFESEGNIINSGIKLSRQEFNFIKKSVLLLDDKFSVSCASSECVILRRKRNYKLNSLIENGFITNEIFSFILKTLRTGKNIVISAPSYSGKTMLAGVILDNLSDKRAVLIENNPQITCDFDGLIKLTANNELKTAADALSLSPDYIVCDTNNPFLFERDGILFTLNSLSYGDALKKITCAYIQFGYPEKFAKEEVLKNIDYIVQLNKHKVVEVVEITQAKTLASSTKIVSDFS